MRLTIILSLFLLSKLLKIDATKQINSDKIPTQTVKTNASHIQNVSNKQSSPVNLLLKKDQTVEASNTFPLFNQNPFSNGSEVVPKESGRFVELVGKTLQERIEDLKRKAEKLGDGVIKLSEQQAQEIQWFMDSQVS